jgi:histone H3/H4
MAETWLKCTECKTDIPFGGRHYVCSVSTCKRSKMRLVFCSATCWDSHLSTVRHRDAWAEEAIAPTRDAWARELAAEPSPPARTPTPALGVGVSRTMTARPANVVGSRPAGHHDTTQPIRSVQDEPRRAPEPVDDDDAPKPRTPALTPDSSQAGRLAPSVPLPPKPAPPPATVVAPPARRVVADPSPPTAASPGANLELAAVTDRDILIVISKLKKYIKDRSGFNCSDAIADALSDHVRLLCDEAIRTAARDERKTVLERDVVRPRR